MEPNIRSFKATKSHSKAWLGWRCAFLFAALLLGSAPLLAQDPWPAEAAFQAIDLTSVEGQVPNDFADDLSGACYDPVDQLLWVCRNGPGGSNSKIWAITNLDTNPSVHFASGLRAEWTGFGDIEALTMAQPGSRQLYLLEEELGEVHLFDLSVNGAKVFMESWDLSPFMPDSGRLGGEGICFVNNASLTVGNFLNGNGETQLGGADPGGLFFVGHQNGGHIFVFDLPPGELPIFVGRYATSYDETAGLDFDPIRHELFAWHDAGHNKLEILSLESVPTASPNYRQFLTLGIFNAPESSTYEGIAIVPASECEEDKRSLYITVDDGGTRALLQYEDFTFGCNVSFIRGDCNENAAVGIDDAISMLGKLLNGDILGNCLPSCDSNFDNSFDLSDAIYLLSYLFSGSTAPAAPFPSCGTAASSPLLPSCVFTLACP